MAHEATGDYFAVDNDAFNTMVSENTFETNQQIEELLAMYTNAAEQETDVEEIRRHEWRAGFLMGVKFTRIGF